MCMASTIESGLGPCPLYARERARACPFPGIKRTSGQDVPRSLLSGFRPCLSRQSGNIADFLIRDSTLDDWFGKHFLVKRVSAGSSVQTPSPSIENCPQICPLGQSRFKRFLQQMKKRNHRTWQISDPQGVTRGSIFIELMTSDRKLDASRDGARF